MNTDNGEPQTGFRVVDGLQIRYAETGGSSSHRIVLTSPWLRAVQTAEIFCETIGYPAAAGSEDKVMDAAIEAGAEDVESDEDGHTIYTAFEQLSEVATALEAA